MHIQQHIFDALKLLGTPLLFGLVHWLYDRITMALSDGSSCMVYIVAADIKPRFYESAGGGIYVGNYKTILKSSDLVNKRFTSRTLPHMHAVGVAKLVPGTLSDGLFTTWTPQEHLWWTCMRCADDVVSY